MRNRHTVNINAVLTRNVSVSVERRDLYPALCDAFGFGPAMYKESENDFCVLETDSRGKEVIRFYKYDPNSQCNPVKYRTITGEGLIMAYKLIQELKPLLTED